MMGWGSDLRMRNWVEGRDSYGSLIRPGGRRPIVGCDRPKDPCHQGFQGGQTGLLQLVGSRFQPSCPPQHQPPRFPLFQPAPRTVEPTWPQPPSELHPPNHAFKSSSRGRYHLSGSTRPLACTCMQTNLRASIPSLLTCILPVTLLVSSLLSHIRELVTGQSRCRR